jgi:hypothetical protein
MLELLSHMFSEDEGIDLLNEPDVQLEAMLPYYSEVERWALKCASKQFGLNFEFHSETKEQECFQFTDLYNNTFYCFLDGYNETDSEVYVIEVKATTNRKFKELGPKRKGKIDSIFELKDNIYRLRSINAQELLEKYGNHYRKLFDPYSNVGANVYDIAVERYIIENGIRQNRPNLLGKKFKYYLAVLNGDYVFPGEYKEGEPVYGTSADDSIISFVDMTEITEEYLPRIDEFRERISRTIHNPKIEEPKIGSYCEFNRQGGCLFSKVCFPELFEKGAITEYMYFNGITEGNKKYSKFDLINANKRKLSDIPRESLTNLNQLIQRDCYDNSKEYINLVKIESGLTQLEYPLYHLDFESFPCPLPRFRGERAYSQSLFQYSIHLEREPGICDEIIDNYSFLGNDFLDHREELIHGLINTIDLDKGGTVIVYNKSFESNRLKELMEIFPEYRLKLKEINESIFDLMDLVKTKTEFYKELGFEEEESKIVNYYHNDLRGLYSIKKILPLFSDLSYEDLDVKNGTEAIAVYARFKSLPKEDIAVLREDLIKYCRQDTWAMVVILKNLRKKLQDMKKV